MQPKKWASAVRVQKLVPLASAAGIVIVLSSWAGAEVEQELDALVVSATRVPTDSGKTTASVTVLDPEELRQRGVESLQAALNEVPGVISTSTAGQAGAAGSLCIRGTTTAYSQIVVDGVRLSDATGQTGLMFGSERLGDLGRVEVLRGAQSAFYGGEAVGGVVWLETARGGGRPGGSLSVEAGSFGSLALSASGHGTGAGGTSWFLGGGGEWTRNDARDDGFRMERTALRVEAPAGGSLTAGATFRQLSSDYANYGMSHDTLQSALGTVYLNGLLRPGWQTSDVAGFYQESYNSLTADKYTTDLRRFSLNSNNTVEVASGQRLLAGAFFDHTFYANDNSNAFYPTRVREDRNRYGANLGWEWSPTDAWTTDVAGRWEDYGDYGRHATWRIGSSWKPLADTRIVGGLGKAFRPPTYTDLYGASYAMPNPGLTAEESLGADLGIERRLGRDAALSATVFHNSIRDRIRYDFGGPPSWLGQSVNTPGTTETQGVEVAARGAWLHDRVTGRLTWTYLDRSLREQPRHNANAAVEVKATGKLTLGSGVSWMGERSWGGSPLAAYALVRFYGAYQFTENVRFTARIENALDRDYQLSSFYGTTVQGAGAGLYGGVSVNW